MIKILLVDDTKSVHSFVKMLLGSAKNIEVLSVYNGQEAMDLINKNHQQFDLCLLDWEMPILNGPQTLVSFSDIKVLFPIVMMTTKNSPEDVAHALSLGAAEYLMKPFTKDILLDKIEAVISKKVDYAV